MSVHKQGESIEGLEIEGNSRDPLRFVPAKIIDGEKCFCYKAEFNVFAKIVAELAAETRKIEPNALTVMGETLVSDTAMITAIAKTRFLPRIRQKYISHVSHTHGANEWKFNKQANVKQVNVKVVTPKQHINNALQKREQENKRIG